MTPENVTSDRPDQTTPASNGTSDLELPPTFGSVESPHQSVRGRRWFSVVPLDLLGLAWVLVAGVLVLVPALLHGVFLGSYDILTSHGVTSQPSVLVQNRTPRIRSESSSLGCRWHGSKFMQDIFRYGIPTAGSERRWRLIGSPPHSAFPRSPVMSFRFVTHSMSR